MSYKHNNIRDAVLQVGSLHSMVATMNDELARAHEDLSPARYEVFKANKLQEFRSARSAMNDTIHNLKRDLLASVEKQEAAMLLEHSKNPYIQLISSGAILTADELANVLKQNPGNPLLLRSIETYATDRKIDNPNFNRTLLEEKAAQTREISRKQAIDTLANYLTSYAPEDSTFANPDRHQRSYQMFTMLNDGENKLFEKLDNSI